VEAVGGEKAVGTAGIVVIVESARAEAVAAKITGGRGAGAVEARAARTVAVRIAITARCEDRWA
jgi:hypothetical protein